MTGLFITFEGGDGVGKTTQIELLKTAIHAVDSEREIVVTREPGGTEIGVEIRNLLLHWRGYLAPKAEALLYAADRAHHIETVVRPALARGAVVLQDRYFDSSFAYQGAGRTLGVEEIRGFNLWATGNLFPEFTFLLDMDAESAMHRSAAREGEFDRFHEEKQVFHDRVREEFLALAEAEPARFTVLDASLPAEEIHQQVRERLSHTLPLG